MNFKERLQTIVDRVDDVLGVAISGMDGIILEERKVDPMLDLTSLAAEYSALWRTIDKTGQSVDLGAAQEVNILTEKLVILLKKISPDYFLILVAGSEKNFGKGRFLMRREAGALVEEL